MRTLIFLLCFGFTNSLVAAPTPQSLTIETGRSTDNAFTLSGRDALQQLVVSGKLPDGRFVDVTGTVTYAVNPEGIVRVDSSGLVLPLKEGKATITAKGTGSLSAQTTVTVTDLVNDLPVNFTNQVVPIFTKFGCNSGGCHGKASGQNGFKLSLLGFEAAEDYEFLVKEARGRRISQSSPEYSLLIRKASGASAHGGGKKIEKDTPFYNLLVRWIGQGAPWGKPNDPTIDRIEVFPRDRVLDRGAVQQVTVIAHLSNGTTCDVTRMTQFESNYGDLAEVSGSGLVKIKQVPGSAAIMARFQSHVSVFRATVPLGQTVDNLPASKNFIDDQVFKQLKQLGLPPSEVCDDYTFIRRVTIDLCGRLPTPEETKAYVEDKSADKVEKLVDKLLASGDYADYFANKWSSVLRNRRRGAQDDAKPTAEFHAWIRDSIDKNKPYDQFARELITAEGNAAVDDKPGNAPVIWYREMNEPGAQLEDVAQLFLGQRLACAKCHHHPLEKWSQEDYYGMAAFFTRMKIKDPPPPKAPKKGDPVPPKEPFSVKHEPGQAKATNPRTNKQVLPTGLGSKPMTIAADVDPRTKLAEWMTEKDNPFFAKTLVNRYWKHFLSRGLVDPEDDMRVTNPPSNPELLNALAKSFVDSKYDMKKLIRTICTSSVYRLSAIPNKYNADDRQNYSRYLPKRLNAEVLLDAIDVVTASKTTFKGAPQGTRAVQLPDNYFESYFLSVFGRPDSASACECERSGDATLAQCLHMFNSAEINTKVSGGRAAQLAKDKRPHEERLRELYMVALSREPSKEELAVLQTLIAKKGNNVQVAYEDILWAIMNTKEFLFNH